MMIRKELELYVHIPFCMRKCAYCDFLSAPAGADERSAYVDALIREIGCMKKNYSEYRVSTVFMGGGTPSVLDGDDTARIFDALHRNFDIDGHAEVTMEVNPGTVTEDKLGIWRTSGVNRLSIGLQSADDRELKMLGRIHTYQDFLETYVLARKAGFGNINVDLISAVPGQTEKAWEKTLRTVAELGPEHISAYSLIIEEGTPFFEHYGESGKGRHGLRFRMKTKTGLSMKLQLSCFRSTGITDMRSPTMRRTGMNAVTIWDTGNEKNTLASGWALPL